MIGVFLFPWLAFSVPDQNHEQESVSKQESVSPNEDLMREHGILNRLLLIYQEIARRIDNHESVPIHTLADSANLMRNFIEDYHERLEEEYIFQKFEKSGKQLELIKTLREQHQTGRNITAYIIAHAKEESLKDDVQKMLLSDYLKLFIRMLRPHEAREDTILFPEFKTLISQEEYDNLGDTFEDKEHKLFGKNGFQDTVKRVEELEKQLGIYTLGQFTAKIG